MRFQERALSGNQPKNMVSPQRALALRADSPERQLAVDNLSAESRITTALVNASRWTRPLVPRNKK
jgi:hypothetical protein